jgi:peptidoglycan/xylan/chitin deacetylase (PgdA/CDA1 family)
MRVHARRYLEMRRELSDISEKLETQGNTRLRDIFEDDDWTAVMTWDQIREAHADPLITIGSHTIDHIRLSEVDEDRNMKELIESKAILEAQGISDCTHFCYPNGSLNDDTPGYVRKAGYESAVTTEAGTNPVNTDLMKIKRIHMPDSSDPKMITYVASGMSQAIANIRGNS